MRPSADEAKSDRTFWRGMYLIAFVIGVVVPIASIIAAAAVTSETAWRSVEVVVPVKEARERSDVYWRQDRVPAPVHDASGSTTVWQLENRAYARRVAEGPLLLLGLVWSGATLIGIVGVASGAWIVMATGQKLGIDRARGYLRGMFLMAFATGALVPIAGVIASGAITSDVPGQISESSTVLLVIMWCGMIAVCIAGVFSAA